MSTVLTVGTFDMPHSGHLELFKKCRQIADLIEVKEFGGPTRSYGQVIVGVNSDQFVNNFKHRFPVYSQTERLAIIGGIKYVDKVILNSEYTLQHMLAEERPNFLVVGSDWACKDYYKQIGVTKQWLKDYNITLLYVDYTEGISSSILRERLMQT